VLITSDLRFFTYFADPWTFKVFRAFMEEDGLAHSPELQQLDALIAAQGRFLKSSKWKFFAPTIAAQGQVTNTFSRAGAGADYPASLGAATPDDVDWNVGLRVSLPLFEGGSRFAVRTQAREELSQLDIERNAAAERIALRIRAALHLAGASHAGIKLSRDAAEASHNNLDLVTDAYSRGAVSIIDLLDAQNAALVADQGAANAVYDFLLDLMEVERAVGQFDFLVSAEDRADWFRRADQYIAAHNTREDQ
jgi:outer membrane protein TolC